MKPRTMSMVGPAGPDLLSIALAISASLGALDAMSDVRRGSRAGSEPAHHIRETLQNRKLQDRPEMPRPEMKAR